MARKPGIGKRKSIDRNAKVFHAVQRTILRQPFLESDKVYEYRRRQLKNCAVEEHVTILCDILMGNHSHTILYSEDPSAVQRVFKRLNEGLSHFVWKTVIEGTEYEKLFSEEFPYHLFSSSVRLFPIDSFRSLFITTRYLYENPKHHGNPRIGRYYEHSNFNDMRNGQLPAKDLAVFLKLYGMYPKQVMKIIELRYSEFTETLAVMFNDTLKKDELSVFRIDPSLEPESPFDQIFDAFSKFDN